MMGDNFFLEEIAPFILSQIYLQRPLLSSGSSETRTVILVNKQKPIQNSAILFSNCSSTAVHYTSILLRLWLGRSQEEDGRTQGGTILSTARRYRLQRETMTLRPSTQQCGMERGALICEMLLCLCCTGGKSEPLSPLLFFCSATESSWYTPHTFLLSFSWTLKYSFCFTIRRSYSLLFERKVKAELQTPAYLPDQSRQANKSDGHSQGECRCTT